MQTAEVIGSAISNDSGTFCAEEVARVVQEARIAEIVNHRRLVLPRLSAPGVAAHRVREACGFRAIFGPVRAADLPAFLTADMKADAEMRAVTFAVRERAVLAPVEISVAWDRRMVLAYGAILAVPRSPRPPASSSRCAARCPSLQAAAGAVAIVASLISRLGR